MYIILHSHGREYYNSNVPARPCERWLTMRDEDIVGVSMTNRDAKSWGRSLVLSCPWFVYFRGKPGGTDFAEVP